MRAIVKEDLRLPYSEMVKLHNCADILIGYVFFEPGKAGASLLLSNISVYQSSINTAIALRKNQQQFAHTLCYGRNLQFSYSLIDLVLRYDRLPRTCSTRSFYYWSIDGSLLYPPQKRSWYG